MNELPSHEKRVCLFAAQQLASRRNGGFVTIDSYPDEEERQQPAIDLLAHDSLGRGRTACRGGERWAEVFDDEGPSHRGHGDDTEGPSNMVGLIGPTGHRRCHSIRQLRVV